MEHITMKKQVFIIDTSAILSGKPIRFNDATIVTTPGVSAEINPGGKDFRSFELLKETGLAIHQPSKESLQLVKQTATHTGDDRRLSSADIELLALALDINTDPSQEAILLTDDYSIQNVATTLHIRFEGFSQKAITKKFKWVTRCPGCGKTFTDPVTLCPICGTSTKSTPQKKKNL